MRTSLVSKERSKVFDITNLLDNTSAQTPNRITRSALARFSYSTNTTTIPTPPSPPMLDADSTAAPDIEDVIPGIPLSTSTTTRSVRKRKRAIPIASPTKIKVELETSDVLGETEVYKEESVAAPSPRRRVRRPARVVKDADSGETTVEAPSDWEEMYEAMKDMRLNGVARNAAVDTMGCERLAEEKCTPREKRYHTLTALMLSSQTKDTINFAAMRRLKTELPPHTPDAKPGLTIENIIAVEPPLLNELIWQVGFHNNKTKFIKQTALILRDKFNNDIPSTIEDMISLPGVGPKMAYLVMSSPNGWNRIEGIGVDVHVHRITNLWGWQRPPSKTPEETRLALQSWLPREKWREINWLLVGFGQTICLPIGRKCGQCELGSRGLCKSAERKKVIEGRKLKLEVDKVEVEVKVEDDVVGEAEVVGMDKQIKDELDAEIKEEVVPKDDLPTVTAVNSSAAAQGVAERPKRRRMQ